MTREDIWAKQEDVQAWCDAEGCEGADFVRCLNDALGMYDYSQDDAMASKLIAMIDYELEGWKTDERIVQNYHDIKSNPNHAG